MLVGADVIDEFKFNKLSINYSNLYNWLLPSSIKIDQSWDNHETTIIHTPPENIEVELNENFKLKVSFGYTISHSYHVKDFTIPQDASLILTSKTPYSFEELFEKHDFLKYFLILFTGIPIYPLSILVARDEKFMAVFPDLIFPKRINKNYEPFKMNFLFPRMKGEFDAVMKRWFELCDSYKNSIDLFFSSILNSNFMLLEIKFLRLASVLEAFHREKNPGKKNMTFKIRIKEIIQSHPNLLSLIEDVDQFSKQVLDVRNYYAHGFLKENEKFIPSNMDLIFITKKLKLVIIFCLMNELPLNKEEINEFYTKTIQQFKNEEKLNRIK